MTIVNKYIYFSTFVSGFSPVIEKALALYTQNTTITKVVDGMVTYVSESSPQEIEELPFFNNSFHLLSNANTLKQLLKTNGPPKEYISGWRQFVSNKKTFRIIVSKENQLISIEKQQLEKLESVFSQTFHLEVDRAKPDIEIWFLERSEGFAYCGIRLTKKPSTDKYLKRGELRPELAWLLSFLSEPKSTDVFLDPFAGHGSIPHARKQFPFTKIIASDIQTDSTKTNSNIEFHNWDALKLPLDNNSIDTIVTDPPWGSFEQINVEEFYPRMMNEFARVMKVNGIVVLLTAQKELMEKLIQERKDFELKEKYNILVSGKKSGVYKLKKIS